MRTEYTINKDKLWEPLKSSKWFYLIFTIGFIINVLLFRSTGVLIFMSLFGVFVIFHLILHLQHYFHDNRIILVVDTDDQTILYIKDNQTIVIPFENIQNIYRYKGSKYPNPFIQYIIPSNFYNWTMIQTKNGLQYSFSDFIKEDLNIYGIKKQVKIVPFLNLIRD